MRLGVYSTLPMFILIYMVVPFTANLLTLFFADSTAYLFLPERFLVLFDFSKATSDFWLNLFSFVAFPIITIVLTIYTLPIAFYLFRDDCSPYHKELAKKRIVNSPIIISLLGFGGWELSTISSLLRIEQLFPSAPAQSMVSVSILFGFWGLFVFAFSYGTIDLLNKLFILPKVFPEGGLGKYASGKRFSLVTKQFIYWSAATLFPILLLVFALLVRSNKNIFDIPTLSISDLLFEMILTMILLSLGLNILFAATIQKPLELIETATEKIKKQEFGTRVIVHSSDELGVLGDAINDMAQGLAETERIKDTFGRIVDPRIRDYLLSNEQNLGGKVVEATILFSDLRDFTKLSEKRKPEEVLAILNRYFQVMSEAIESQGGFINKFIGDAILAVFGTPMPMENHAEKASLTALQMFENLEILNQEFEKENLPVLRMGIGIHTGSLLVGNIGSQQRMEFTVIGDTVNTASRVEGMCKGMSRSILLTEHTKQQLPPSWLSRLQLEGEFELKGRVTKEKIFSLS